MLTEQTVAASLFMWGEVLSHAVPLFAKAPDVHKGLRLAFPMPEGDTESTTLYTSAGVATSGFTVAIPSGHSFISTYPCIAPNLFLQGVEKPTDTMSLVFGEGQGWV